jgi:hypothetical protein
MCHPEDSRNPVNLTKDTSILTGEKASMCPALSAAEKPVREHQEGRTDAGRSAAMLDGNNENWYHKVEPLR